MKRLSLVHRNRVIALTTAAVLAACGWLQAKDSTAGKLHLKSDDAGATAPAPPAYNAPPVCPPPAPGDLFRQMARLQRQMDRFFADPYGVNAFDPFGDDFGFSVGAGGFGVGFQSRLDVRETPDAYIVQADLPGLKKSEISIELRGNVLVIDAARKVKKKKKDERWVVRERGEFRFHREIALPKPVDADKIEAVYRDGVLTMTLPKKVADAPARKIHIK